MNRSIFFISFIIICLLSTKSVIALPTDYIAYWKFDEGSGSSVADSSSNNNTCTINGATWTSDCKLGYCLSFDGINDYIDCGNDTINPSKELTVSAWVKFTGTQAQCIVCKEQQLSPYYGWSVYGEDPWGYSDSGVTFLVRSTGGSATLGNHENIFYNDGKWHHVAVTFSSLNNVAKIYVDGFFKSGSEIGNATLNTAFNLVIGSRDKLSGFFNGIIDEVKIYNRALTAYEINPEYGNISVRNAGFEEGYVYWTGWNNYTSIDNTISHTGLNSLKISLNGEMTNVSQDDFAGEQGKIYKVSAWIKTENYMPEDYRYYVDSELKSGKDNIYLRFYNNKNQHIPHIEAKGPEILFGTNDWSYVYDLVKAPSSTVRIELSIQVNGFGTVWIDDINIKEASNEDIKLHRERSYCWINNAWRPILQRHPRPTFPFKADFHTVTFLKGSQSFDGDLGSFMVRVYMSSEYASRLNNGVQLSPNVASEKARAIFSDVYSKCLNLEEALENEIPSEDIANCWITKAYDKILNREPNLYVATSNGTDYTERDIWLYGDPSPGAEPVIPGTNGSLFDPIGGTDLVHMLINLYFSSYYSDIVNRNLSYSECLEKANVLVPVIINECVEGDITTTTTILPTTTATTTVPTTTTTIIEETITTITVPTTTTSTTTTELPKIDLRILVLVITTVIIAVTIFMVATRL